MNNEKKLTEEEAIREWYLKDPEMTVDEFNHWKRSKNYYQLVSTLNKFADSRMISEMQNTERHEYRLLLHRVLKYAANNDCAAPLFEQIDVILKKWTTANDSLK